MPTDFGEDEFTEKKSRFIGRIWPVENEEEALAKIQEMKKKHYDATHNCWAYIIRDGAVRFSDDGEPGGTAGMPMLQVLQREGLFNVVCSRGDAPAFLVGAARRGGGEPGHEDEGAVGSRRLVDGLHQPLYVAVEAQVCVHRLGARVGA